MYITKLPPHSNSTWTYSHSQLDLFRICPRRYYERYIIGPGEESIGPIGEFSKFLVHYPIEARAAGNPYSLTQWKAAEETFLKRTGLKKDFTHYGLDLALGIMKMFQDYPLAKADDIHFIEVGKTVGLGGWQYQSKPDLVRRSMVVDLKLTESWKVKPLFPFSDQFVGQALVWGRPTFSRYVIQIKKDKCENIVADEMNVDPVMAEEWVKNTVYDIKRIEECHRLKYWPQYGQGCQAWGRDCPYWADCSYGFTQNKKEIANNGNHG